MPDLYHKGVLITVDYWVRKESFSVSEYPIRMSLIDSIPEKWKVADYRINVSYIQLLTAIKNIPGFPSKSINSKMNSMSVNT